MAKKSVKRSKEWLDENNTAEEAMSSIIFHDGKGNVTFKGKNVVLPEPPKEVVTGSFIATGKDFKGWGK